MIFQCANCKETFEQDGLQVIVHDKSVLRICPTCLANANTVTVTISRRAPGRPFEFALLQTDEESLYEVNDGEAQGD